MAGRGIGARFAALGGGEALARLAAFVVTVYLARVLGPALFGSIAFATAVLLYLTQLADAGIELVGIPLVARSRQHVDDAVAPVMGARVLLAAALTALTLLVGLTLLPQPDGTLLALYALTLPLAAASTRWVHLGLERTGWVAAARLAGELLALALIVLLLRDASQVYYVPVAVFAGQALLTLLLIAGLRRMGWRIPVRLDWGAARETFARSRHLVAFTLLGLVLFNFDLLVIRFVRGSADAGFYSAAYTLIAFGANLIVAFAHTVMPALARLDNAGAERTALFQRAMLQAFAVALPAGVGASLIAHQILGTVFGSSYEGGIAALRILALSLPLAALREIPVVALIANGDERSLVRVNAVTALCNAVLVLAAVPLFGLAGAAWATVATEVIRLALAVRSAREAGFAAIAVSRLWQPGVAALAMAALILLVRPSFLWLSVLLGVLGYALALAILTRGGVLRRGQASHAT